MIKKCTNKCAARAKLLLGSVVKLDRASVHTYNGDFGPGGGGYCHLWAI